MFPCVSARDNTCPCVSHSVQACSAYIYCWDSQFSFCDDNDSVEIDQCQSKILNNDQNTVQCHHYCYSITGNTKIIAIAN